MSWSGRRVRVYGAGGGGIWPLGRKRTENRKQNKTKQKLDLTQTNHRNQNNDSEVEGGRGGEVIEGRRFHRNYSTVAAVAVRAVKGRTRGRMGPGCVASPVAMATAGRQQCLNRYGPLRELPIVAGTYSLTRAAQGGARGRRGETYIYY